jgi:hypothetical protein
MINLTQLLNEMTAIDTKVTKNGKPLLMYHGGSFHSGDEFTGRGWFTSNKADAKYYATQNNGNITKAFLIVKNPLYTGHIDHLNIKITKEILLSAKKRRIENSVIVKNGIIEFIEANAGVLIAIDIGRDGVIDIEDKAIIDVVIFSNSQIVTYDKLHEDTNDDKYKPTEKEKREFGKVNAGYGDKSKKKKVTHCDIYIDNQLYLSDKPIPLAKSIQRKEQIGKRIGSVTLQNFR